MTRSPARPAREAAVHVATVLREAGFIALFAGGCVRDHLRGADPQDYDIATDARPADVLRIFPRAQRVGEAFGVMLVRESGHVIEVATFRRDGDYDDGRRPKTIEFASAEEDAQRRDFTINGLFEDPLSGEVTDYVNGLADLKAGVIRAIGRAEDRLHEDHLRALRAVRFASRFGFTIADDTTTAIRETTAGLRGVSRERIGHELRNMLSHASRATAAELIEDLGLDGTVFDELAQPCDRRRLASLPERSSFARSLAAWLLDRHGAEATSSVGESIETVLPRWTAALVLSGAEADAIHAILVLEARLRADWLDGSVARRKRDAASPGFHDSLVILETQAPELADRIRLDVEELARTELAPPPWITGDDLIRLGASPGPSFTSWLDTLYDAQLEGRVTNREEALLAARELLSTSS